MSMTDLDQLTVGCTLGSLARDAHGNPATWGMVVDFGLHPDTEAPYVEVLEEVPNREIKVCVYHRGAKVPRMYGVARLRRLDLADVDPESIEEPHVSRMHGWAKKALAGEVVLPGAPFALAIIAAELYEAAKAVLEATQARQREATP